MSLGDVKVGVSRRWRGSWAWGLAILAVFAGVSGCLNTVATEDEGAGAAIEGAEPESLKARVDDALTYTLQERTLSVEQQAAWQILHGVLAYQRDFEVVHGNQRSSAVDYLLAGGEINGWTVRPGKVINETTGERGLIAVMEPGTKTGQGHHDQWLAILAQANLPREQEIKVGDSTYTIHGFVEQVKWDVPRNLDAEYSWTLIGLTAYEPTNATWTASDGQEWSIERLLRAELSNAIGDGACGGTHRLIGIAMALNRHVKNGGEITGVWEQAQQTIRNAVDMARQTQNPDGTFSTNYITLPGSSPDLAQNLGSTGHVLEFLSIALSEAELQSEWVRRAAAAMCNIFERTRGVPLECGSLYHAAHGLVLYRERMFGPRGYALR